MVTELIEHGEKYIAVPVGDVARGTGLSRILALKTSPGWLVEQTRIGEWRFEGVVEKSGSVFLYGAYVAGTPLSSVLTMPVTQALPFLLRLVQALARLSERGVPRFPLETDTILFTGSGGVLFLPPEVCREIRDHSAFSLTREGFESINHPDLKGDALASFSLAAILYRIITGSFPFMGAGAEEMHEQARKLEINPPSSVVPELSAEVSALVMAGLGRARREGVTLAEWADSLSAWQGQELFHALSPEEKEQAGHAAAARQQSATRSFGRRMFWEKNWKVVAIVTIVIIVAAAGVGSIVRNVLAPRVTRGFTPARVVETFYTSMNTLDHQTMQACVVGRAGREQINEATTLYVTSRVTQGYEGKSNVLSAADWDRQGRPLIVSPATLYGVTGVSLKEEQPSPAPVFLVTFDKWNPASPPDTAAMPAVVEPPKSEGHRITERVWLKKDRGDWVIYRIDRRGEDLLPPPLLASPPASSSPSGPGSPPAN
jgi:hypothetical protein